VITWSSDDYLSNTRQGASCSGGRLGIAAAVVRIPGVAVSPPARYVHPACHPHLTLSLARFAARKNGMYILFAMIYIGHTRIMNKQIFFLKRCPAHLCSSQPDSVHDNARQTIPRHFFKKTFLPRCTYPVETSCRVPKPVMPTTSRRAPRIRSRFEDSLASIYNVCDHISQICCAMYWLCGVQVPSSAILAKALATAAADLALPPLWLGFPSVASLLARYVHSARTLTHLPLSLACEYE